MCPQKKEEEEAARKKKEQEEVEAWDKAEKEAEEAAKASGAGFNARCDATLLATLCSCCSGRCASKVRCIPRDKPSVGDIDAVLSYR